MFKTFQLHYDSLFVYLHFKGMLRQSISYTKYVFTITFFGIIPSLKDKWCNRQSFAGVLFFLTVTKAALEVCLQWLQLQSEGSLISGNV